MKRFLFGLALCSLLVPLTFAGSVTPNFGPGQNDDDGVLPRQYFDILGGAVVCPVEALGMEVGLLQLVGPNGVTVWLTTTTQVADHIQKSVPCVGQCVNAHITNLSTGEPVYFTSWKKPSETPMEWEARTTIGTQFLKDLAGQ